MKVFISHTHESKALAKKIGEALRRAGLDAWNYEQEILPGDNWAEKISQALEESEAMVVLLTPAALDSMIVRSEIDYALSRKTFSNRLIPVLVGSEEHKAFENLPWILRRLNMIRLPAHGRQEEGINQITQALRAVA